MTGGPLTLARTPLTITVEFHDLDALPQSRGVSN